MSFWLLVAAIFVGRLLYDIFGVFFDEFTERLVRKQLGKEKGETHESGQRN